MLSFSTLRLIATTRNRQVPMKYECSKFSLLLVDTTTHRRLLQHLHVIEWLICTSAACLLQADIERWDAQQLAS